MSKSRKVGPFSVRPEPYVYKGTKATKWRLEIPASLTDNGKRKRKLFDTCKEALTVARELRKRIDPATGQIAVRAVRSSGVTFAEILPAWQQDEELRVATLKKRATTFEGDLYRLKTLKAFLGVYPLKSITARQLAQYQKSRLDEGRKPRTINREMETYSVVMSWAKAQGHIDEIVRVERIPVAPSRSVVPTPEEAVRIIQALPQRLQPLVRFLFETGCRPGEATNLTWDHVDEVGGYVEIVSRDGWTPKTSQSERRVPLNASLLELIRSLPKKGPYVFAGPDPYKPIQRFRKAFVAAIEKADIRRRGRRVYWTPHVCRKAHATWQALKGVNESVLQDLLGHARGSEVTKRFYVHTTEEAKKAAVIELPIGDPKVN